MSKSGSISAASKPDQGKRDGDDLSTILESGQGADLTLLIANCTESMRKVLLDNFDANAGLDQSLMQGGLTEDQKMMITDPKDDVSKYEAERKLKEESEKDINTPKMKNLKKNSLKTYDEWRDQVLMRVGEVVNDQETAKEQLQKQATSSQAKPQAPNTIGKITDVPQKNVNIKFKDLFPPTKTALTKLPMSKRTLVMHSVLLLLISLEHYNAYSRILMLNLCSSLKLPLKTFEQDEYTTAKGLLESARELTADEETKKKQDENKENRTYKVRMATAAGAAVLGIAGGMAAPLVAAGVGSVMGGLGLGATAAAGYLGSVAGSTILVGGLFGAYGGRMTGQMMDKYAREVEDFEFLSVHSKNKTSEDQTEGAKQASEHDHKLRVTICISGWLTEKEEVVKPWRVLGTGAEVFALKYELEALLNLGHAMDGMVTSAAWGYAQKELISRTIFADLMGALWPIGLLKVARVLDNPFSVAKSRADKAGEVLADALINRAQGERPVTLIGYSLGARLIYTCLMSLAKRKAFGLVENAVMMGTPAPSDTSDWRVLRSVVSGRLANVYSTNDYLLGFMYRTSSLQYGVAGLQPVRGLASVENVDVSEDIDGHLRYRFLIGAILKKIGFEDVDMAAVEEERRNLDKIKEKEKKQSLRAQRARLMRRKSTQGKETEEEEAEHEVSEMEKNVQQATEKSLMTRVIEYFYAPKVPNTADAEKVAGNLAKAVQNPSDAKGAVTDTYNDVSASTRTYTQYVISKLPSMPGGGTSPDAKGVVSDPGKATGKVTKSAGDAAKQGQSYVSQASAYLPSISSVAGGKSPNAKKATPDVSNATNTASKAAGDATKTGQSYVAQASSYLPSISSVTGSKPPDVKKKAPDTSKATDKAPKTATETTKSGQTYVQQASSYLPSFSSKKKDTKPATATENAENAASTGTEAVKTAAGVTKDVVQPTVNNVLNPQDNPAVKAGKDTIKKTPIIHQASDRIPGANKAAEATSDTLGTTVKNTTGQLSGVLNTAAEKGGEAGKAAGSNAAGTATRAAEKTGLKSPPPKKETYVEKAAGYMPNMPSWGGKGGRKVAPKLEKRESQRETPTKEVTEKEKPELKKTASGAVQQRPDLKKTNSGVKSPPPKLERMASGMKSPPKLERVASAVKGQGGEVAKKVGDTPQQGMKAGTDAAGKASKTGQDAAKTSMDTASKAAKSGQDVANTAAKTGKDATGSVTKAGQNTVKAGGDAAGKAAKTGQDTVKQGGGYLAGAGSAVAGRFGGWGSK